MCRVKFRRLLVGFHPEGSAVAQWWNVGLRSERSGVRNLPPPCCVLEQDTLLPESTG